MSYMNSWIKTIGPHLGMMFSLWWATSTRELKRTIQEEKGP